MVCSRICQLRAIAGDSAKSRPVIFIQILRCFHEEYFSLRICFCFICHLRMRIRSAPRNAETSEGQSNGYLQQRQTACQCEDNFSEYGFFPSSLEFFRNY